MANFLSDARAALRVADAALVVVDAVPAPRSRPRRSGRSADELALPRLVVLNRLDRERASLDRALESLRGVFGRTVIPIQLPIGEEKGFEGVVDLVAMKAWTFATDGSGKPTEGDVPGDLTAAAQTAREALIEMVAEADDALMEKFFDAGTLTQDELVGGPEARRRGGPRLSRRAARRRTANIGMQPLLDAIITTCRRRPSGRCGRATQRRHRRHHDGRERRPRPPSSGRPSRIHSRDASRCFASSPARSSPTDASTT